MLRCLRESYSTTRCVVYASEECTSFPDCTYVVRLFPGVFFLDLQLSDMADDGSDGVFFLHPISDLVSSVLSSGKSGVACMNETVNAWFHRQSFSVRQ